MHLNYNFAVQSFGSDPSSEGGGSEHLPPPFFPYNPLSNLQSLLCLLIISTSSLFSAQAETTHLEPIPMMVTPGEFDAFEQELEDIFVNHSLTEEISIFSNLSLLGRPTISTSVPVNHSESTIHFSNSPIDLSPIYPTTVSSRETIPSHKRERESDHAEPDSSSSEQESPNWSFSSEEGNQKRIRGNRSDSPAPIT